MSFSIDRLTSCQRLTCQRFGRNEDAEATAARLNGVIVWGSQLEVTLSSLENGKYRKSYIHFTGSCDYPDGEAHGTTTPVLSGTTTPNSQEQQRTATMTRRNSSPLRGSAPVFVPRQPPATQSPTNVSVPASATVQTDNSVPAAPLAQVAVEGSVVQPVPVEEVVQTEEKIDAVTEKADGFTETTDTVTEKTEAVTEKIDAVTEEVTLPLDVEIVKDATPPVQATADKHASPMVNVKTGEDATPALETKTDEETAPAADVTTNETVVKVETPVLLPKHSYTRRKHGKIKNPAKKPVADASSSVVGLESNVASAESNGQVEKQKEIAESVAADKAQDTKDETADTTDAKGESVQVANNDSADATQEQDTVSGSHKTDVASLETQTVINDENVANDQVVAIEKSGSDAHDEDVNDETVTNIQTVAIKQSGADAHDEAVKEENVVNNQIVVIEEPDSDAHDEAVKEENVATDQVAAIEESGADAHDEAVEEENVATDQVAAIEESGADAHDEAVEEENVVNNQIVVIEEPRADAHLETMEEEEEDEEEAVDPVTQQPELAEDPQPNFATRYDEAMKNGGKFENVVLASLKASNEARTESSTNRSRSVSPPQHEDAHSQQQEPPDPPPTTAAAPRSSASGSPEARATAALKAFLGIGSRSGSISPHAQQQKNSSGSGSNTNNNNMSPTHPSPPPRFTRQRGTFSASALEKAFEANKGKGARVQPHERNLSGQSSGSSFAERYDAGVKNGTPFEEIVRDALRASSTGRTSPQPPTHDASPFVPAHGPPPFVPAGAPFPFTFPPMGFFSHPPPLPPPPPATIVPAVAPPMDLPPPPPSVGPIEDVSSSSAPLPSAPAAQPQSPPRPAAIVVAASKAKRIIPAVPYIAAFDKEAKKKAKKTSKN